MNKRQFRTIFNKIKRKINFRSGLNFRRKRYRVRGERVRYYGIWAVELFAVVLLSFFITKGFGMRVVCSSEAMEESIHENATTWVNRVIYHIKSPQKGDVIAFLPGGNANAGYNIKRVVGVPGDKIKIENGRLYINDKMVEVRSLNDERIQEAGRAANEITLGKDEYFVLGDNINNSEDSRYETVGNIKKSDIYGKVWFVPSLHGFGFVD